MEKEERIALSLVVLFIQLPNSLAGQRDQRLIFGQRFLGRILEVG